MPCVEQVGRNSWVVDSPSGNTYTVRLLTKLDALGNMYFQWTCTCPSRQCPCKHALAVEAQTEAVDPQAAERIE